MGAVDSQQDFFDVQFVAARSPRCCATDRQLLVAACNLIGYVAGRDRVFAEWVKFEHGDVPTLEQHPIHELNWGEGISKPRPNKTMLKPRAPTEERSCSPRCFKKHAAFRLRLTAQPRLSS